VISGISRVKALRQAVISNQTSSEATQAGFEVGTRTGVDVVNAQREVFRAKRDYAQSRYDYILDTLRLKRAAGMLTPTDLTSINTWLSR
jgi:outer membrane protein